MRIYKALGIAKKQVAKRQPWKSYAETTFNVMRTMADWHLAQAATREELEGTHDRRVANYSHQVRWAQRERQDGRHSPAEVPGTRP